MAGHRRSTESLTSIHSTRDELLHGLFNNKSAEWQSSMTKLILPTSKQDLENDPAHDATITHRAEKPDNSQSTNARAWLQVLAGFILFMNTWGVINAFGVFESYYSTELLAGTSESAIAWIGTLTSFLLCASPIFWGPVFDLGYARALVLAGSISIAFGVMMTSLCRTYWQLMLAQGLCVGFGGGCTFLTAVSILPAYFPRHRALAMGVVASGSSLGGIIYPVIFHQLQPKLGFAAAVRVIGTITIATLLVPCLILRPKYLAKSVRKILDLTVLKDKTFELFNLATFLGFVGQYIPFFFIQLFAVAHDIRLAFWMLILLNVGSIPGRIIPSLLADQHFRPLAVLSACTFCASLLAFCWTAIKHSTVGLAVWAVLYGFFSGAFVSLQGPTVASMASDMTTIGTRFGFNMFCGALGILIGSPVAGAILSSSWTVAQVFCGTTLLFSAVMVLITDRRWRMIGGKHLEAIN